jgi:hypothetical protein
MSKTADGSLMTPKIRIALAVTAASAMLLAGCSSKTSGSGSAAGSTGASSSSSSKADFSSSAASSSSAAVAGGKSTAELTGGLIAATDLGSGWVANPDDSDDDDSSDDCDSDVNLAKANRAEIELDNDDVGAVFSEQVGSAVSVSAAKAAYAAFQATVKACSGQKESDGSVVTLTPIDFPKVGDDSTGYKLTATSDGTDIAGNVVVVRDGSLVELYLMGYEPASPASGFAGYVTIGVTKAHSLG